MKLVRLPIIKKLARFYLYKTLPDKTNAQGFQFYLQKNSSISLDLVRLGVYEKAITDYVKKNVKSGQHVIDIGSNIGYYSLLFSKLVGDEGKVYSFEPELSNFEILCKNIKVNKIKNIITEKIALSDKTGVCRLFLSKISGNHSIFSSGLNNQKYVEVKTTTLDNYLINNYIDFKKIAFIKIDVEGAEFKVMKGMMKILKNNSIHLILEFSPNMIIKQGNEPRDMLDLLIENDFGVQTVDNKNAIISKQLYSKSDILKHIKEIDSMPYLICKK